MCFCLCVRMCACVVLGLGAKPILGVRGWGSVVGTPSRELGISGESGKNISMVINQNSCDTNDQKQRTVLHPCHCVTSAPRPCPTHLRLCPIGRRPPSPDVIGPSVPERNRDPLLANWAFVIAQSVVGSGENETRKRHYGGWGEEWQVEAGRRFLASQSARCSSWVHYDALQGIEMVSA